MTAGVEGAIVRAYRGEWARVVAALTRRFGDLGTAEDAAAEAFATAVERWPRDGVPANPGAWLTTTASRKAIDRVRRESHREATHQEAQVLVDDAPAEPLGVIEDDRLRLVFTCCHPALSVEARVALTLRMVGGLTVPEIARAFLVQETTMGQRLTRAKAKIKAAHVPYRVPTAQDLPARLDGVLAVLFLVFNEGYLATGAEADPVRAELTAEAIRLTRLVRELVDAVGVDEAARGEVVGLLALMLMTEARRPARISATGELVTLDEQVRSTWDRDLIEEGHRLVRLDPSPVVALNRAVAVAEVDGPDVALALVEGLPLAGYHAFHATRAELLRRLGRRDDARKAYDRAIDLAGNSAEVAYLTRRRGQLGAAGAV